MTDAGASSPASRASRPRTCPTRRRAETFERSKLDPQPPDPLVTRLLRLRRELPRELDVSFDEAARRLELRRGRARLACRLPLARGRARRVRPWPGKPLPARAGVGRGRHELLALLRARDQGRALPLRRGRPRAALRAHGAHGVQLARLLPGHRPGPAVRLPGVRALGAGGGPPLQPGQAPDRSLREGDRGSDRLGARATRSRTSPGEEDADLERDDEDDAAAIPKSIVIDHSFNWEDVRGPRTPWHETVIYETHVKGFTKQMPGVREDLRGTYAGLASEVGDRLSDRPRRDGGRAAADPPHRRRAGARGQGADELLGLQLDRLPRAARRVLRDGLDRRPGARVQGHGEGAPPCRHRGDPRRRLQPHRRGQPPRADAVVQGHRQPLVLPHRARDAALLHGLHRHGQLAQPGASVGAAADHGLAPLLRDRVPRRRLPLRPRLGARPRVPRGRPPLGLLRHHPPGPGALPGEADRRALGRRRGRLPGRQLPGALDGVERHLPGHDARLLARPGRRRRLRLPLHRLERPVRARRPQAVRLDQLHHRARRLHAARPRLVQREAQRGEPRGESRRGQPQPQLEPRRRGGDRRPGDHRAPRPPDAELPRHAVPLPGRADAARRRRVRTDAARQQQRVLPGQRALLARLGARRAPAAAARVHEAADRVPPPASGLPAGRLPDGRGAARARDRPTSGGSGRTAGR